MNTNGRNKQTKNGLSRGKAAVPALKPEDYPKIISRLCEGIVTTIAVFEKLGKDSDQQGIKTKLAEEVERLDFLLALIFRNLLPLLCMRAAKTTSTDLFCDMIGSTLSLSESLPDLIERFYDKHPEDREEPDNFIAGFGETLCTLVERLEDFADRYPVSLRPVARDYPYWPMLHLRNAAANNHFPRIADAIQLGENCVIHASEKANFSLKTPVNKLVWRYLSHFQNVHRVMAWWLETPHLRNEPLEAYLRRVFDARIQSAEFAIYQQSYDLPRLSKSNAKIWADKAIMPFVRLTHRDLRTLSEFKTLDTGPHGRKYAIVRKVIIQSLQSMARSPYP